MPSPPGSRLEELGELLPGIIAEELGVNMHVTSGPAIELSVAVKAKTSIAMRL